MKLKLMISIVLGSVSLTRPVCAGGSFTPAQQTVYNVYYNTALSGIVSILETSEGNAYPGMTQEAVHEKRLDVARKILNQYQPPRSPYMTLGLLREFNLVLDEGRLQPETVLSQFKFQIPMNDKRFPFRGPLYQAAVYRPVLAVRKFCLSTLDEAILQACGRARSPEQRW